MTIVPLIFHVLGLCLQAGSPPNGLPAADWNQIRAQYERHRHAMYPEKGGWRAHNRGQQWTTRFDGRGFQVKPDQGTWTWGMTVERLGGRRFNGRTQTRVDGNRLSYLHDQDLTEWFVNEKRGLEHGFTLHRRSAESIGVRLELTVQGDLYPRAMPDRTGVQFVDAGGATVVSYSGLKAWDADGKDVSARLGTSGDRVVFTLDDSGARYPITIDPWAQQVYLKASNSQAYDYFGFSVAISGDTVVVGAPYEDSSTTGVNTTPNNDGTNSGAAYVFVRSNSEWTQQAYLKASNTGASDYFGHSVAIDGNTIVVGAYGEASNATSSSGDQTNDSANAAGAAYVFVRSAGSWSQQAYLKASNSASNDRFAAHLAISGETIVVGAEGNDASVAGPPLTDNGAAYVFTRSGAAWTQQAYLKSINAGEGDMFGHSVGISGNIIVVGAWKEDSNARGIGGSGADNSSADSGAAYIFSRSGTTWPLQAYLKSSNSDPGDGFGESVAISGTTVVIGARFEDGNGTSAGDNSLRDSGAAYVFVASGGGWVQQAYLKAANPDMDDWFGGFFVDALQQTAAGPSGAAAVAVSGDLIVVGASREDGSAVGASNVYTNGTLNAGAAYVFARTAGTWAQQAYLKASNHIGGDDYFGCAVAISGDTAVIGAIWEDSNGTGVNGSQDNRSADGAGAAYVFRFSELTTQVTINSTPSGLVFNITGVGCEPGTNYVTPRTLGWATGATCTVTFASPQTVAGTAYLFQSWENGSTNASRTVTASSTTTITATFAADATCELMVSPHATVVSSTGGVGTSEVTSTCPGAWTATSTVPWLTISGSNTGTNGTRTLTYSVAANTTGVQRTGAIDIIYQTRRATQQVTQSSTAAVTLTYGDQDCLGYACYGTADPKAGTALTGLAPNQINSANNSYLHSNQFPRTQAGDYSNTDQIFIESTTRVPPADGYSNDPTRRAGPMTFGLDYSSLVPPGRAPVTLTLGMALDDFQFPRWGRAFTAAVNGAPHAALTAHLNAVGTDLTGPRVRFFTIGIDPAILRQDNILNISINGGGGSDGFAVDFLTIGVTTEATVCTAPVLSPTAASFLSAGGQGSVTIASPCPWTATTDASWITLTAPASGGGNGTLSYQVAAYTATNAPPRAGTIFINGTAFVITQSAASACTFTPTPKTISPLNRGGLFRIDVSAPASCGYAATTNAPWMRVVTGATRNAGSYVELQVDLNTGAARSGTLTIGGQQIPISQSAGTGCTPQVSNSQIDIGFAGSSLTSVQVLTTCAYTAVADVPWIQILSGGTGTMSGTLALRVLPNTGSTSRRGTVTISGKVITMEQAGPPLCQSQLSLSRPRLVVPFSANTQTVTITLSSSCPAPALLSQASWITATLSGRTVTLTIAANASATARSGIVSIGTRQVAVLQAGNTGFSCSASATAGTVRREGFTELTPAYRFTCGGTATSLIQTELQLTLNTNITSKVVARRQVSEAMLVLQNGQAPQLGVNAFRGIYTSNRTLRFSGLPLAVAGANAQQTWQVENLRVDATPVTTIVATGRLLHAPLGAATQTLANVTNAANVSVVSTGAASYDVRFQESFANALRTQAQENGVAVGGEPAFANTGTRVMVRVAPPAGSRVIASSSTSLRLMSQETDGSSASVASSPALQGPPSGTVVVTWEVIAANPAAIETFSAPLTFQSGTPSAQAMAGFLGPIDRRSIPRFKDPGITPKAPAVISVRSGVVPSPIVVVPGSKRAPVGNRSAQLQIEAANEQNSAGELIVRGNLSAGVTVTACDAGEEGICEFYGSDLAVTYPGASPGEIRTVAITAEIAGDAPDGSLIRFDSSASIEEDVSEDSSETCLAGSSGFSPPSGIGATGTIDVYACGAWTLTSSVPWIRFQPSSGTGNASVTYTVDANPSGLARTGQLTFPGGASGVVTQLPAQVAATTGLRFEPVQPCRIMETRDGSNFGGQSGPFGPPYLRAGETRTLVVSQSVCGVPASAKAWALNVTVIPRNGGEVEYVTLWPAGEQRPPTRTVSSPDGQIVANTAFVKALGGAFSLYASDDTDLIIDITGYFTDPGGQNLVFYPLTPCRVTDTRALYRPQAGPFGPPSLVAQQTRSFAMPQTPYCSVPSTARAYSVTITVVPPAGLAYLTMWPTGAGGGRPNVSSINSFVGRTVANNVIVPAGTNGSLDVFAFNNTDLLIDINGYFAPDNGTTGLYYYPQSPCIVLDTTTSTPLLDETARTVPMLAAGCGAPNTAKAYALNATSLPDGRPMPFLTLWPTGQPQPGTSVSNAFEGQVVTNFALIPAGTNGNVEVLAYRRSNVVIEVMGYFDRLQ
ncbi:MAG: hypothetical protein JNK87_40905 [Bryobacterales bacterium]|nr:hypothetical protein [Bryobacterales bacterium]